MVRGLSVEDRIRRARPSWSDASFLARLASRAPNCLTDLAEAGVLTALDRNAVLITEGSESTDVFLLLDGRVKVTARAGAAEALIAVRVGGDIVGELAAVDRGPRSASVRVSGRQTLVAVRVPGPAFIDVLSANPDASRLLQAEIAMKLRAATRRRADHAGLSRNARVAKVLQDLARHHGLSRSGVIDIDIDLSNEEIGALSGLSGATVYRALADLRRAGAVKRSGRKRLVVVDVARLAAAAEGTDPVI